MKNFISKVESLFRDLIKENSVVSIIDVDLFDSKKFINDCIDLKSINESWQKIFRNFKSLLEDCVFAYNINKKFGKLDPILKQASSLSNYLKNHRPSIQISKHSLFVKTNICLLAYSCSGYVEVVLKNFEELKKTFDDDSKWNSYYRGQPQYKYDLLPTMYRELDEKEDEIIINYERVYKLFDKYGFISRYQEIKGIELKKIDYDFMSYIQHSSSYSPLLDFTTDYRIASIFATSPLDVNPNTYSKQDSALFVLMERKKEKQIKKELGIDDMEISYSKKKYNYLSKKGKKYLFLCNQEDFYIDYTIKTEVNNDRMINQKGLFFFLIKGTIVNGRMLIPFNQLNLFKIKFPANAYAPNNKWTVYETFTKQHRLSIESLMNPYLYIGEYSIKKKDKK